mmetsp:Transcript_44698/g.127556  ORF Transcript_44698/g.127556 Transcript_44698/m.127556 type:complete len:282 (-) Transcript_44698:953-1798(-)
MWTRARSLRTTATRRCWSSSRIPRATSPSPCAVRLCSQTGAHCRSGPRRGGARPGPWSRCLHTHGAGRGGLIRGCEGRCAGCTTLFTAGAGGARSAGAGSQDVCHPHGCINVGPSGSGSHGLCLRTVVGDSGVVGPVVPRPAAADGCRAAAWYGYTRRKVARRASAPRPSGKFATGTHVRSTAVGRLGAGGPTAQQAAAVVASPHVRVACGYRELAGACIARAAHGKAAAAARPRAPSTAAGTRGSRGQAAQRHAAGEREPGCAAGTCKCMAGGSARALES